MKTRKLDETKPAKTQGAKLILQKKTKIRLNIARSEKKLKGLLFLVVVAVGALLLLDENAVDYDLLLPGFLFLVQTDFREGFVEIQL